MSDPPRKTSAYLAKVPRSSGRPVAAVAPSQDLPIRYNEPLWSDSTTRRTQTLTKPRALIFLFLLATLAVAYQREIASRHTLPLPTSKLLVAPVPGRVGDTNGLPVTTALSPDGHYLV